MFSYAFKKSSGLQCVLSQVGLLAGGVGLGELADSEPGGWGEDETLDDSEIIAVKNEATKKKRASEREKRRKEKERSSKLSWESVQKGADCYIFAWISDLKIYLIFLTTLYVDPTGLVFGLIESCRGI